MVRGVPYRSAVLAALCLVAACASELKETELQNVAKDWALTIRASQVIPVYPLTEDLQPGDVFLVTTPIQKQADAYREKGFLPLDQHLTRLKGLDFSSFYGDTFGVTADPAPPDNWRFPDGTEAWREPFGSEREGGDTAWTRAPRAFFPSYSFNVETGKGLDLAIPIQTVPVSLAIMETDSATGSATLRDAFTYGVSLEELQKAIAPWRADPATKRILEVQRALNPETIWVRVVNRVYLAGGVTVSITNNRAFESNLGVGTMSMAGPPDDARVAEKMDALRADGKSGAAVLDAGGKARIRLASGRAVTADETFDRPLVIGFIAFDFPVLEGGELGPPAMTLSQLEGEIQPPAIGKFSPAVLEFDDAAEAVKRMPAGRRKRVLDAAADRLGAGFIERYEAALSSGSAPWDAFDTARMRSVGSVSLEQATQALNAALGAE